MRKLIVSLMLAATAIAGLFLLLSAGRTAALTAPSTIVDDGDVHVKFDGAVQSRPLSPTVVGEWLIGEVTVTVDLSTTLDETHGPAVVGAWVEVEGYQQADGSVLAEKIETERNPGDEDDEFEFKGIIEEFAQGTPGYLGEWQVSGIRFTVTPSTTIEGAPEISAVAEVEALRAPDGSLSAKKVEIKTAEDGEQEREWNGFIEQLGAGPAPRFEGEWIVGGISVTVNGDTELDYSGAFTIGDWVEVEAYQQLDGSLLADKVQIEDREDHDGEEEDDVQFYGVIQYITPFSGAWPITWQIGYRTVWLTDTTIVDESKGPAVVGAWAEVEADDVTGQLWALKIEIEQEGEGDDDEAEIEGLVTNLNPLIIAGQEIVTDTNTVIQGTPALSITAEAKGRWVTSPTLYFLASEVEFKGEDDDGSHYEIEGSIASLPADPDFNGTWVVTTSDGLTRSFDVVSSTVREFENGDPALGCWAQAETALVSGVEVATEVEVEHCGPGDDDGEPDDGDYFEHEGEITQLGDGPAPRYEGEWVVGGISFTVDAETFIDTSEGTPEIGRKAEVKATGQGDQWIAFHIDIDSFEGGSFFSGTVGIAATQPGTGAMNVSRTSGHSRVPDLVVRANGDHHLVWEESDGQVYHSWKIAGGAWSLPLPVRTGSRPNLIETAGTLYLIWADDDGAGNFEIYLAEWTGGGWSAPKNVSQTAGQSISPDVAADGAGNLHFAWADNTPGFWVIYHGTLSANAPVPSAEGQAPRLAVADDGALHLAWQDSDLSDVLQVYYSRSDGAAWGLPQDVSHSARASSVPAMALDSNDDPHLVWEEMQAGGTKDIFYTGFNSGAWSTPIALANTVANSFLPAISFGDDALHVAWTEAATASTDPSLLYRKLQGSGLAVQTVWSNGTGLSEAFLEADDAGQVHIAWANYSSSGLVNPTWDWDIYYGAGQLLTHQIFLPLVSR
jgi:hypothetical protein